MLQTVILTSMGHTSQFDAGASIWFDKWGCNGYWMENWGVVGPGLKNRGDVDRTNSTDGGA